MDVFIASPEERYLATSAPMQVARTYDIAPDCKRPLRLNMVLKRRESAGKPGSVVGNHSSGITVTSILKRPTRRHRGPRHSLPIWSCSRWGLPCHKLLPVARCALTAPFHPYLLSRRFIFCCTFRRLTPPRNYLAPCPVEPGLSSLPPYGESAIAWPTLAAIVLYPLSH